MILRFRATIPQSKIFYKVYAVDGGMDLFDFNTFILGDLGFAPDQMVLFEGYDGGGKLCGEYGLFDMGDGSMDKITFEKLARKGQTELHYIYDMRNDRYIRLVMEGEETLPPTTLLPCLLEEKGHAPEQFSVAYEDYEAVQTIIPKASASVEDEDFDDEDDEEDGDEEGEEIYDENE